jgi:predicted extracellular nuclease
VTYNAERFFDPNCDSADCGGYENVPDESDYQNRVRRVATGLEQLEADVLVLQEIETKRVLRDLNNAMASPFPVVLFGEIGRPASLDVGMLSRGSLRRDVDYRGRTLDGAKRSETVFLREFLRADLVIGSETLTVFAAHFKSMANDNPGRRRREASRAARIVDHVVEEQASELYILGGDLNAGIESDAISTLLTEGKLRWVGRQAEPSERWTYRYGSDKLVLDYLLWRAEGSAGYAEGSTRVFRDSDFDGFAGSDHGAVRATFEF